MSRGRKVVVSCEHGGYDVPRAHLGRFGDAGETLRTHRGWDAGAAPLARRLSAHLGAPCFVATVTRLLVDLNRSAHHPAVFSEFTRALPAGERAALIETYHTPHRARVERAVREALDAGFDVLHLGVHSFTPAWRGEPRAVDLSLLYDPARDAERTLAARWVAGLAAALPEWRIRRNVPYRGTSDGLTTTLRKAFPDPRYMGIEIEVNQRFVGADDTFPDALADALIATLPPPPEGHHG